jgi:hypothetical protein
VASRLSLGAAVTFGAVVLDNEGRALVSPALGMSLSLAGIP